ncbi:unnamed protein product [Parascedosporium putredinis]|uniref:Pre-mRNA-splicing factor SYF1 n=1 Tax=Parascedosporium putredinis TaxID=1442378 RepID=A0A9P1HDN0_9PEZI|nr:unnamed protein product [Parascedosporium putredinis]CAI8004492.1 unnamed protein product [Parascedosporium putredinis]
MSQDELRICQAAKANFISLLTEEDAVYEQDILRNLGSATPWISYFSFKIQHGTAHEQAFVLERACRQLPRSYKLWKASADHTSGAGIAEQNAPDMGNVFEVPHATAHINFHAADIRSSTSSPTFNPAQPHLGLIPPFANSAAGNTAAKIWRRYMQIRPEDAEDFIGLLTHLQRYSEAVHVYLAILNNPRFVSKYGKGAYELWSEMVDLLVEHATRFVESEIDAERLIRTGLARFPDQRGKLWCGLAAYWVRKGSLDHARDIFEEGITTVMTVRDFALIFDSYVQFEESVIDSLMESTEHHHADADFELDLRIMHFDQLMDRRPFLLNDLHLRQNPNNVAEWEKRAILWGDNAAEVIRTYTDAIVAIQPRKAYGAFHQLWTNYAKFYEKGGDLQTARVIMEKAVKVPFKSVAELADMWIEWAEMELRNDNFNDAVRVMAKAVQAPKRSTVDYFDENLSPQQRVHKSWKLWSFYVDLVESVSSLDETKKVYERIFELRIATPQTVVNYASLLEEHKYFEESFKIYERGLDLFSYPVAFELWNLYLGKAVDRRISIERLRDLFEQAIEGCPAKFAKVIYLMYGNLEEERGLARHAMRIYERATRAVADEDRADMFNFYITKSASNFGLPSTRPIYEKAISTLPDTEARDMCLKFADMEKRLGEIDRARAIYGHASQFCDPRTNPDFWSKWEAFEVQHGNEDTFKEMLRIKRSVQAQYNTDVNFIASQAIARGHAQEIPGVEGIDDAMAMLERQAKAPAGFVAAKHHGVVNQNLSTTTQNSANPDVLDIDDIDD